MTSTVIMSAVACGTSTNVGDIFGAVKTTLQATTTLVYSNILVTTTPLNANLGAEIILWQAVSPTSYSSAADGALALQATAKATIVNLKKPSLLTVEMVSDHLLACGAVYHYAWLSVPKVTDAFAVTTTLQELA